MHGFLEIKNRNTVRVFARIVFVLDRCHQLVKVIDGRMGIEFTTHNDTLTVRRDIDTVRRLWFRHKEERIVFDRHFHRNDPVSIDDLDIFVIFCQFCQFFPVVHMEVVRIVTAHTRFKRGKPLLDTAGVHLGVERVGKSPAVTGCFTCIGEILHIGRHLDREGLFRNDLPFFMVELPDCHTAAIGLFVLFDRVVVVVKRCTVLARFENVLRVWCKEGTTVV